MEDIDAASSSDDDHQEDLIIGIRTTRNRTNYRFRYDALNQRGVAMRNYLLDDCQHLHNNCNSLICIILLLYQMIRLSCLSPNGRLVVYPILVLYLCDQKARLDATQRQLDDLLLIREGDRVHVAYPPRRNRSINELTEEHAYEWTRFSKEQLIGQIDAFRDIIRTRMSKPPTPEEVAIDPTLEFVQILEIAIEFFRIFGFLDCTDMRTTRTGSGPQPDGSRRPNAHELQLEFYSRYFRAHGLKFLSVLLPNGMVGAVFGAALAQNDNGVINLSGLVDYLMHLLEPMPAHNLYPSLFGDSITQLSPVTQSYATVDSPRNRFWKHRLSSARQSIELDYGLLFNNFRIMIKEYDHRMFQNGEHTFHLAIVCFFLKNCYVCFNGSTTNTMFNSNPPSIAEYLPLEEDLLEYVPMPIGDDYNYDYG